MSQTAHQFDPTILREYDIRGIVGDTVHAADARAIGRTFGTMVRRKGGKRVALGYDGRLSSPELAAACIEGLTAAGIDVIEHRRGGDADALFRRLPPRRRRRHQITGSHNPPDYNGFKMMMGKKSFFGADIQTLGAMAGKGDWESGAGQGREEARPGRLCRAAAAGREARQEAQGRLGHRQRRGRRVDPRRRRQAAGRAFRAEREGRRHLPGASSRSDGAEEPRAAAWPR